MPTPRLKVIAGDQYGRLTIVKEVNPYVAPSGYKTRKFLCKCSCGREKEVLLNALRSGDTQSCGCLQRERAPCKNAKARGLRVGCDRADNRYNVWSLMIERCMSEAHTSFDDYGAKGISVCDRWLELNGKGFTNFCDDMGERLEGYTLDRRDNSLGYFPDNCRWTNKQVQSINREMNSNNTSGHKGVTWSEHHGKWLAQIGLNYRNINLGHFDSLDEAVLARKTAEAKYFNPILKDAG